MKVAALDLGSNTFLCLIADVVKHGESFKIDKVYSDEVEVVRLGQDVDKTKRLHPEALERAQHCLAKFKRSIEAHQPEKILAMATSAARDSENREELFEIGRKLNIPIEIIPGPMEAQITFQGSLSGQNKNQQRLVVDIGGGSTEFIIGDLKKIHQSKSLNIGCVRLTEKFIHEQPTPDDQIAQVLNFIDTNLSQLNFINEPVEEILAVAGTPTSLVAAELGKFDPAVIDGFALTEASLLKWKERLQQATVEEKILFGIPKGRADVILIGVLILLETLKFFNKKQITVSTRGVRHGIALEMARRYLS